MLTKEQVSTLQQELLQLQKQLETSETEDYIQESAQDSTGELSMYDNHPADAGSELFEREKDMALSVHAQSELDKVQDALQAIKDGDYGKCEVCGKEIPYERLEALPYTTLCVDHATQQLADDRPVEEDILIPAHDNSFSGKNNIAEVEDYEDSFQEVAKYGTSETPSDFEGDFDDYNELYEDDPVDGFTEEYETFSAADLTGKQQEAVHSEKAKDYVDELEVEGMESPLGDIPYKRGDSYLKE